MSRFWALCGALCGVLTCFYALVVLVIGWTCSGAYKSIYNVFVICWAWACGSGCGRDVWALLRLRWACRRSLRRFSASPDVRQGVGPVKLMRGVWASPAACVGVWMLCGVCPGGDGDGLLTWLLMA